MVEATCHCGAVRIEVARRPRTLTACDCSICGRYGAIWAYYSRNTVRVDAAGDADANYLNRTGTFEYHFCRRCGCVTHYRRVNTKNDDRIAVNVRMMAPEAIESAPIRKLEARRKSR